ncbi:MAG: UbiX family flavin prenyltransferase [Saprospiraceae bacterium]|nr:UbiX family flavin prenyltransferase [Saprospiraceae bacterium]
MKHKIAVGITGASGAIYAKVLLDKLKQLHEQIEEVGLVMTKNAKDVWEYELGNDDYKRYPFEEFENTDYFAPFASGSANYSALIIAPCSMGTMGRIANGTSNNLITRAGDVMLKERRKLILLVRDTPYSLIHLNNMRTITEAGGIICPASPSFYSRPESFEALAATVVDRAIDLAGLQQKTYRWGSKSS